MDIEKINDRLSFLVKEIETIYQLVNEGEPELPPEALEKLEKGICLKCGARITKKDATKAKRGCHERCYASVRRRIKDGVYTEYHAISQGIIAPSGTGGRPAQLTELEKKLIEKKHDPEK